MFSEHNGHTLAQMDEAVKQLRLSFIQIDEKVQQVQKNMQYFESLKAQINDLKAQQLENVEVGFIQIFRELEKKKSLMMQEFVNNYENEIKAIDTEFETLTQSQDIVINIGKNNVEYKRTLERQRMCI